MYLLTYLIISAAWKNPEQDEKKQPAVTAAWF